MLRTLLALLCLAGAAAAADQPNFVLIFVDDLGYNDIGPFGSKLQRTPTSTEWPPKAAS